MKEMRCRLAVLMAEKDPQLSLAKVARDVNLSYPTLHNLRRNHFKRVDTLTVSKLCEYFDCDINDLFVLK
jgi:putative transcriptional regulator